MDTPLTPLLFFTLILSLILTTTGCVQTVHPPTGDDFTFTTINGETKHLSDYRSQPVLLDFMGVACQPCQQEMFILHQLHQNYTTLTIISIDVWTTQGETTQDVHQLQDAFHTQYNITLDWTFAVDDASGTLGRTYAPDGVPHLYLYTKQGNLYYNHLGYEPYSTLVLQVDAIIN